MVMKHLDLGIQDMIIDNEKLDFVNFSGPFVGGQSGI